MDRAAGTRCEGEELEVKAAGGEGVDLAEKEGLREEREATKDVEGGARRAWGAGWAA
jgi:hypothetical protein